MIERIAGIWHALALVSVSVLASIFVDSTGWAQEPGGGLPSRSSRDGNGVDVVSGTYTLGFPTIGIGGGAGSLSVGMIDSLTRYQYGYDDTMRGGVRVRNTTIGDYQPGNEPATTTLFGVATTWQWRDGGWQDPEGRGRILKRTSSSPDVWELTDETGAVATFRVPTTIASPYRDDKLYLHLESVVYPTGEKLTFVYDHFDNSTIVSGLHIHRIRLKKVTSSLGYELVYSYVSDVPEVGKIAGV